MVVKISFALNKQKKSINGSKILFLGVSYKADIDDMRESPALPIIEEVVHKGAEVFYHDPHVPVFRNHDGTSTMESQKLTAELVRDMDCVVVTTRHEGVNYDMVAKEAKLIVDLRNAYDRRANSAKNIVKL
jgi:UDP-N-acetyl-D-glucosamine dehydrogenase